MISDQPLYVFGSSPYKAEILFVHISFIFWYAASQDS